MESALHTAYNDVVKRTYRTLLDLVRFMMGKADLLKSLQRCVVVPCVYKKDSGSAVVLQVLYMWMTYYLMETTSQYYNWSIC